MEYAEYLDPGVTKKATAPLVVVTTYGMMTFLVVLECNHAFGSWDSNSLQTVFRSVSVCSYILEAAYI